MALFEEKEDSKDTCWRDGFLRDFVHFLTYRTGGNAKELQELLLEFIRPTARLGLAEHSLLECHDALVFRDASVYRIQLMNSLYMHVVERFEHRLIERDDKIAVGVFYLLDFLVKFHGRAFTWTNMERIDELVQFHRTPDLRAIIFNIVYESTGRLLHPMLNGMYNFRFRSEFAREIEYLSRLSESSMAAFNFTHDEAQGLKASYLAALKDQQSRNVELITGLAELYELDQQFDEARHQYRRAIRLTDESFFHHVGVEVPADPDAMEPVPVLKAMVSGKTHGPANAGVFMPWGVKSLSGKSLNHWNHL